MIIVCLSVSTGPKDQTKPRNYCVFPTIHQVFETEQANEEALAYFTEAHPDFETPTVTQFPIPDEAVIAEYEQMAVLSEIVNDMEGFVTFLTGHSKDVSFLDGLSEQDVAMLRTPWSHLGPKV